MEEVVINDRNGDGMVLKSDGERLWPSSMKHIVGVKEFLARPDDIFLCSYSRSGTHFVWELIMMLLNNEAHLQVVTKMDTMLEYVGCEYLDTKPSPRVINTHLNYSLLPEDVFKKNCKIVLICRNPKDVAVSFYNFIQSMRHYKYDGKFGAFLEMFMEGKVPYGSWFEYTQEWNAAINNDIKCPIFVVYYEQLKQNFVMTVSQLCSFLGLSRPLEFLQQMMKVTAFDSFKSGLDTTYNEKQLAIWKNGPQFIRKGLIGDWKNWFTVAQNEHFDQLCRESLQNSVFQFIYEPNPLPATDM